MTIKSNAAFTSFPDYVEDTSVTATAVIDVFRGTGNVTMFQIVNGSAAAWFSIFDATEVTLTAPATSTDAVLEIPVAASTTLICSCNIEFSNAVSYAATVSPGGYDNPTQTVALTMVGAP